MDKSGKIDDKVHVMVHYVAAGKPFENEYDRSANVGQVKRDALAAFALTEGNVEGNVVTYTLYSDKQPLENMLATVGDIAGHQKVLQLKLSQQVTQGYRQ